MMAASEVVGGMKRHGSVGGVASMASTAFEGGVSQSTKGGKRMSMAAMAESELAGGLKKRLSVSLGGSAGGDDGDLQASSVLGKKEKKRAMKKKHIAKYHAMVDGTDEEEQKVTDLLELAGLCATDAEMLREAFVDSSDEECEDLQDDEIVRLFYSEMEAYEKKKKELDDRKKSAKPKAKMGRVAALAMLHGAKMQKSKRTTEEIAALPSRVSRAHNKFKLAKSTMQEGTRLRIVDVMKVEDDKRDKYGLTDDCEGKLSPNLCGAALVAVWAADVVCRV